MKTRCNNIGLSPVLLQSVFVWDSFFFRGVLCFAIYSNWMMMMMVVVVRCNFVLDPRLKVPPAGRLESFQRESHFGHDYSLEPEATTLPKWSWEISSMEVFWMQLAGLLAVLRYFIRDEEERCKIRCSREEKSVSGWWWNFCVHSDRFVHYAFRLFRTTSGNEVRWP